MEKGSVNGPGRRNATVGRHPHWDAPAMMAQDIALLDEKTILDGLTWRLEQFLDIRPPYGLITPEIVEAARQDMNECGNIRIPLFILPHFLICIIQVLLLTC